ncbi:MAG: BrnA antitoxin family protein [Treponema sp.]|nr:BrnA antitoxin family protein [Treponema sp.]
MGTVKNVVDSKNPPQLSEESLLRLAALKNRPIDYSDIPELTAEQAAEIKRQIDEGRNKQMFSLRLQRRTIEWWRNTIGEGYTTAMGKLLDAARKHPEWIKESLQLR